MPKLDDNGFITELEPNEIIAVGVNIRGEHVGGLARQAYDKFGLEWGVSHGISGQCFAINTMGSISEFEDDVVDFIRQAKQDSSRNYLLTPIGTGIAGHSTSDVRKIISRAAYRVNGLTNDKLPNNIIYVGWDD